MKKNLKKSGGKVWWSANYFVSLEGKRMCGSGHPEQLAEEFLTP
jgi:hypothetical protein